MDFRINNATFVTLKKQMWTQKLCQNSVKKIIINKTSLNEEFTSEVH
jgi:hypothetical protein